MKIQSLALMSTVLLASLARAESSSILKDNVIDRLEASRIEQSPSAKAISGQLTRVKQDIAVRSTVKTELLKRIQPLKEIEIRLGYYDINGMDVPEPLVELGLQYEALKKELAPDLAHLESINLELDGLNASAELLKKRVDELSAGKTSRLSEVEFFAFLPTQVGDCKIKKTGIDTLVVEKDRTQIQVKIDANKVQANSLTAEGYELLRIRQLSASVPYWTVLLEHDLKADQLHYLRFVNETPEPSKPMSETIYKRIVCQERPKASRE